MPSAGSPGSHRVCGPACATPAATRPSRSSAPSFGSRVSAARIARADGRASGSLASADATRGCSASGSAVRSGSWVRIRWAISGSVPPPKACSPVAANTMIAPQANTSASAPARCPAYTSDAMYRSVPANPLPVAEWVSSTRAIPKSISRGPSGPNITLPGLRSRCTTLAWWMVVSAVMIPMPRRCRSSPPNRRPGRPPVPATAAWRLCPSMYSLTMNGRGGSSRTWRILAVQKEATRCAARASAAIRSSSPGESSAPCSTLIATRPPSGP
ncbi:hypothetical protein LUX32_24305 [Actinomadura madurae]|nr:hypothetical protein [Actinomadura madurae]MCP9980375.1 hypothetical protein [Actinomadura madurae]